MDKQKQIEEMAKDIVHQKMFGPCIFENCPFRTDKEILCNNCKVAQYLHNKHYCKLPEDAVVLTREEYERYRGFSREEVDEISETAIKNSRKETAREILQEFANLQENLSKKIEQLKAPFRRNMNGKEKEGYTNGILTAKSIVTSFKSSLAKQYDVEIKE
jgi:hypothetical protein